MAGSGLALGRYRFLIPNGMRGHTVGKVFLSNALSGL